MAAAREQHCDHTAEILEFVKASRRAIDIGLKAIGERLDRQAKACQALVTMVR